MDRNKGHKSTLMYFKRQVFAFWLLVTYVIISFVLVFTGVVYGLFGFMPAFEELENPKSKLATEVYSVNNELLGKYYYKENRTFANYHELSPHLITALISTEDVRYFSHSGIDFRGLIRVTAGLITGDKSAGGGSTITQQLAKMLFPRENFDKKIKMVFRKFREWVIAVKLEKSYTKEEIITMYLNKFDFLYNAVGIKSASYIYFNTTPDSLKVEQAAMLVGMAKNPAYYNPLRRPELTRARRDVVLSQMVKYDKLTQNEYDSLKMLPLGVDFQRVDHKRGIATYFREYLRMLLTAKEPVREDYLAYNYQKFKEDSLEWATNPLYGWCAKTLKLDGTPYNLYQDGLKIYTTIDSRMQRYAEQAVAEHLSQDLQIAFDEEKLDYNNPPFSNDFSEEDIENNMIASMRRSERYRVLRNKGLSLDSIKIVFDTPTQMKVFTWEGERDTIMSPMDSVLYYKGFWRAGFMSMVPQTGEVRAYVGGPDYRYFMYDMVTLGKRQIGSTIKPFLYSVALQEGLEPCDQVPNIPQTFILPDGTPWTARNSSSAREGEMVSLRWGLANSINNISGWVLKQTKPEAVVKMAQKLGVTSRIDPVPSIFLGTSEISLYEMVGAYSTFVNKGVYIKPWFVTRIEDKHGNVVGRFNPQKSEVMHEKYAYLMTNLLEGVVKRGTGIRLRNTYELWNPIGGKTGTTQNHSDGWFLGITPDLVSGVWVGAEDRAIHFEGILLGQGANMALPIWALYMQKVYADPQLKISKRNFERPRGFRINLDCNTKEEKPSGEEFLDDDFF